MQKQPLRIGVAGLNHDHVTGLMNRVDRDDIAIVGIAEPNPILAEWFGRRYNIPPQLFFGELSTMLEAVRPEAVVAYNAIYDHRAVVQACAPHGVHVMVEKPLAINDAHASGMAALADQHGVYLLTNYETTWYPSVYAAREQVQSGRVGEIRKVVVHDGHRGPKELGCTTPFLEWLTDPEKNGGGAVVDFGCYGANLITWLMDGEEPLSVTAVTQTLKPQMYPKVDDEATIILTYPRAQGIIQASWNWPVSRKDMEIYCERGQVLAPDKSTLRVREGDQAPEEETKLAPLPEQMTDSFSYFAAVVRGEQTVADTDLSALENNLTVVRILDAARESASTGKTVRFT